MRRGLRVPSKSGGLLSGVDGDALSVGELTRRIKTLLESNLDSVTVEGEIGDVTLARSGHLYLTLKDNSAVIDTVMWRSAASRLRFTPQAGDRVVAKGEVTVYEPRGRYQLVASSLKPVGQGDLQAQFEEMVNKLRAEGLFDPSHKKPLPERPTTVGIVTSPTGAAVRDIIKVAKKRMPGIRLVLSPCMVQGAGAAGEIVAALRKLDAWGGCDVIILGRGGGSQEDLWAFNEEEVARAIFAADTPVVSAVGHEVDLSISDLVADFRAATPSEAAEAAVPNLDESLRQLSALRQALGQALTGRIRDAKLRLSALSNSYAMRRPMDMIRQRQQRLDDTLADLSRSVERAVDNGKRRLQLVAARLEGLNPLAVISRGYSVTTLENGAVVHAPEDAAIGSNLITRVKTGVIRSCVTSTEKIKQTEINDG